MDNFTFLISTINNDIKDIFNMNTTERDHEKLISVSRCINTCFIATDTFFIDTDLKTTISKKLLVMYNLAINLPDIMEYDVYMTTIYDKLKKKFTTFAENFHHKALSKDINIEYHLCMINFYNNNDVNTQKLYNYYYDRWAPYYTLQPEFW